jgi:retron-type reverse transcriptase
MDISKFFDTIDYILLMNAVEFLVQEKWILLYTKRWLVVPYKLSDGKVTVRTCGVTSGFGSGTLIGKFVSSLQF